MAQTRGRRANVPVNRIEGYLDKSDPRTQWRPFLFPEEDFHTLYFLDACHSDHALHAKKENETEHAGEATDWTKLAQRLVERLSLENRIEITEKELKDISARLTRVEGLCEKAFRKPVCVPISTFAPEPFEVIRDFSVVVQPEEDSFVATLFDANISSSGETQEEAIANVKDLILMIIKGFESEDDSQLGPAMIRQKHVLLSLIRRK